MITSPTQKPWKASRIVVPGVGHFSSTAAFSPPGWRQAIRAAVSRGTPLLGICVGMQWMFQCSSGAPEAEGWVIFLVRATFSGEVKSPHVGWNPYVSFGTRSFSRRYPSFIRVFHAFVPLPMVSATVASVNMAGCFPRSVERDRVFGVQFHPEKSG